jgi:hypothetical protein
MIQIMLSNEALVALSQQAQEQDKLSAQLATELVEAGLAGDRS